MNIPNFTNSKVIDEKGYLTSEWKQFFMQLITELQKNLSNEGYYVPRQTSSNIVLLNTVNSIGGLLYNDATNKLMVNENGTYKAVTTT